ncbi:MAG: cytochrome c maturation protein CcmE [Acidobacteriota bacterium]
MKKNKTLVYLIGAGLLLIFAGFSYSTFTSTLTPYVSYAEAIATTATVQVAGGLLADSSSYDAENEALHFTLVDPEDASKTLPVRYHGLKPANFEDAVSIVAIGAWSESDGEMVADKLLVKCPSKYQGIEEDPETHSYG